MNKKTIVLGASAKSDRYSNRAVRKLNEYNHDVIALGFEHENINEIPIETDWKNYENIDTVTLYLNPQRQKAYYKYILDMKPRRIIFNPGTENAEFEQMALNNKIIVQEACTLVLLSTGQY